MSFHHPLFFILLLFPLWYAWRHKAVRTQKTNAFLLPSLPDAPPKSWKILWNQRLWLLEILAMIAMIIALARPYTLKNAEDISGSGIDIMLAIDVSGSMMARDFQPNRLEVAKEKAIEFVQRREGDRMGLVIFSGESFMQCPLTVDHRILMEQISHLKVGVLKDGTAIGMGLASAVSRLKDSEAQSKVVVLLTDGIQNAGQIDPETATELAVNYGVVVYTIGLGASPDLIDQMLGASGSNLNEESLRNIAKRTGGTYFRAQSDEALSQIYTQIDEMEKSKFDAVRAGQESLQYRPWLALALLLLGIVWVLRLTVFKSPVELA